ncbi:peptide ABC transporter substrate-binding protein [Terribacillus saccharophilus]|uniref:Peptide ABC transporter substrate-binding protein n=1 Tax=Terribacillus saccharophilus TaxID=361277 RepID=A0ABX4GWP7_9BACI|nr:peptide ABC transporter substrate-binding protein [Terribacillus saccharophilus]PAD34994.1 peptide ABC transporter substrate-binding protein [Terribacillus saccharophilus]PAD95706.1 peptide ABC transporter substrate-binding protein [Terribacillus saccharophilus]PAD99276.1 peptide ABC transporter substrate-binding protein [Terribacillus saccharophilus]
MRKTNWLLLALVLVLSSFLAACSGGSSSSGGSGGDSGSGDSASGSANGDQIFNMPITDEIPSMDPSKVEDALGIQWVSEVMEGLYRLDENGKPVPGMADGEPEISEDGLTYTFKIKDNAEWSNGEPVTAQDFVYAWQRAVDPATASEYGPYMMGGVVKNATQISSGEMDLEELGVQAEDDKTLVVELEKEVPYFQSMTTFATFFPLNQKFVEEQGDQFGLEPENILSNGPFEMTEWNHSQSMKFVKNETYWDAETVQLEELNLTVVKDTSTGVNLYETGELDRAGLSADFVDQYINDANFITEPEPTVFYLKMNQKRGGEDDTPFANENVRKAVAQAINKEDYVNVILNNGSTVIDGLMPADFVSGPDNKDFRETNGSLLPYDLEAAQAAWEKAKEELGTDEITIEMLGDDGDTAAQTSAYFKDQLEKNLPGLTVENKQVPFKQRLELDNAQDYDLQVAGWGPDYVDANTFMNLWVTDGANNGMSYSSEEYDALIESANGEHAGDPEARWNDFLEAEKLLMEDAAIAPLYQRSRSALQSPKVQNVFKNASGPDYEYKWAYADNAAAEQ